MKYILRLLRVLYLIYFLGVFIVLFIPALVLIFLLSLINTYFTRKTIFKVLKVGANLLLYFTFMPPIHLGKKHKRKDVVMVANHISYLDAILLFPASLGYFRPLGKIEISRIPVFGFVYRQIVVLVDRSSRKSRAESMKNMNEVIQNRCNVFIFPEGTFNETDQPLIPFHDGAFRLAIENQAPIAPILFLDSVKRFNYRKWYLWSPGMNRIVYLPLVHTSGYTIEELPYLKQKVFDAMHQVLDVYNYPYFEKMDNIAKNS